MSAIADLKIPVVENAPLAAEIAARWNSLAKPPGSLGRLEDVTARYALIRGEVLPRLTRKAMYVFCGDHGVTEEGVSAFPSAVTVLMVRNFLQGGAAINVLCRHYGIDVAVVDCGVNGPVEPGVIDRKVACGTANFARGPAMTREQAVRALRNGIELAREAAPRFDIAAIGEMGIGNTTSASALLCAFAGISPAEAAGRGTGLDPEGIKRKTRALETALKLHQPDAADPVGVLAAVGGFEIGTMAGFLLGAAESRLPVVVDGFIASSAAVVAAAIAPEVKGALLFAHRSAERAHQAMLAYLGVEPMLHLDLRLGEGSAAAIGIGLVECGVKLYREMALLSDLA